MFQPEVKISLFLALVLLLFACTSLKQEIPAGGLIISGTTWFDSDGRPIEAHGGGILLKDRIYYWYGENHALGEGNKTGISCYSSADMIKWVNEGVVFSKDSLPSLFRDKGVCERPKVLFNAKTGKYIMWMHLDGENYTIASAGVAISDSYKGPFRFLGYQRPVRFNYGYKPNRGPEYDPHEQKYGNTFRDMNLFLDDDGKAYVIYASEDNASMYCVLLNDEYTGIAEPQIQGKTWQRILPSAYREAPAPFKYNGKYYLYSSGLTGWAPNPATLSVSDSILGPWKQLGNPCLGLDSETTFQSQSTFVIAAPGRNDGSFIFMADRWNGNELQKSSYVWLPLVVLNDKPSNLFFLDRWDFSIFDFAHKGVDRPVIRLKNKTELNWPKSEGANFYVICRNGKPVGSTGGLQFILPGELAGKKFNYTVIAKNILGEASASSNPVSYAWNNHDSIFLGDIAPDFYKQGYGSLQIDRSINQSPLNIAGRIFSKGLGTHSYSEIIYYTGGHYKRFKSWIGVDHYPSFSNASSIIFEIYGDGKLLFQSKLMRVNDPALFVDMELNGVAELKLVVTDAGDGTHYDHADWAEARLIP